MGGPLVSSKTCLRSTSGVKLSVSVVEVRSITREDILQRARHDGQFAISWISNYRPAKELCEELVQAGQLRLASKAKGVTVYQPTK